jgi:serine/threonine protein kinase
MNLLDTVNIEYKFDGDARSPWKIKDAPKDNPIVINNKDYFLGYLDSSFKGNKGGNSRVFALFDAQYYDEEENEHTPVSAIKISRYWNRERSGIIEYTEKNKRFNNEVTALFSCKEKKCSNIVDIEITGHIYNKTDKKYYPFYIMEYAESDLKQFIEAEKLSINEKVKLCLRIAQGLKELDDMNYYHRDLKPDNIFIIDSDWKIGDLGLVAFRNLDSIDNLNEFIGPRGWITPEAMNKYLTENKNLEYNFDCTIDHQSDIFQLGKVFWYIMQGNAPIGCVRTMDFRENNTEIYALLRTMLNHSKKKRYKHIDEVIAILKRISEKMY